MRSVWWSWAMLLGSFGAAWGLERPWVSDVFFYWYEWDEAQQWGNWTGQGVYLTPLVGYYDSRKYEDTLRELWMASEWGMTHHFIDFWGHNWRDITGKEPRENLIFRAAEELRKQGYPIWVSFYQDGTDFDMRRFRENAEPGRHLRWILENYARSPVFPYLQERPFYLVYARNGAPIPNNDVEAFRRWLRRRYGTLEALNRTWGTSFAQWEEVQFDEGGGIPRADTLRFYFEAWRQEWEALEERVRQELGLPGVRVSFDVAYQPYRGYGYSLFAATFGGPHSYAGIFDQPHAQDIQRFVQSIVAKHYGTVFFDHLKNFYHDWELRIPGTAYPPEPFHFDRFWVGNLLRYAEAVLHLSWNEWWEGSNLEPCLEYGKTYCEKNLFYSTLLHRAFPSVRDYARDAQVAVLLNDWQFLVGSRATEDLYGALRTLRALTVPFELLPDDFVTAERLERFRLVFAPAATVGFGQNAQGEAISEVLERWVSQGKGRRLVVSSCEEWVRRLALQPYQPAEGEAQPGPDMNVFVDVGVEGDERFLVEGFSGREDWGRLPPGAFGARPDSYTVRWTPESGRRTVLLLPASPQRDHVLRWEGTAFRPHRVTVFVNGQEVGTVALQGGHGRYELPIPAKVVGPRRAVEVLFLYERPLIPREIEPQRFGYESRACNLALDWLQFATAGTPLRREAHYEWPESDVHFTEDAPPAFAGRRLHLSLLHRQRVTHPQARIWSRYEADGTPHLLALPRGEGTLLYLNGLLGELPADVLEALVRWSGVQPPHRLRGEETIGAVLEAEGTLLALAYHEDIVHETKLEAELTIGDVPLAEALVLSSDGRMDQPLPVQREGGKVRFVTPLRYFGVYALVRSPVAVETPPLRLHPGEQKVVEVRVRNLTGRPVEGFLRLDSIVPTLGSDAVRFALGPSQARAYRLTLKAKPTVDWGRKTVALKVNVGGQIAYFFRPLTVGRLPEVQVATPVVFAPEVRLTLHNRENGFVPNATVEDAVLEWEGQRVKVGTIPSGGRATVRLPWGGDEALSPGFGEGLQEASATFRYRAAGQDFEIPLRFGLAVLPRAKPPKGVPNAVASLRVMNGRESKVERELVVVNLDELGLPPGADRAFLFVCDAEGNPLPTQVDFGRELLFPASLGPRSVGQFWLCAGPPPKVETDLHLQAENLGSGRGRLTLENGHLRLVLDEGMGGTARVLESKRSGRDYGGGSFGAAFGHFGHFDPLRPAANTAQFIQEEKVWQRESAGARVRVLARGPLRVIAEVDWSGPPGRAHQAYEFRAFSPALWVESIVIPAPQLAKSWRPGDEIVVLDARLQKQHWTKIFPNFTGIPVSEERPHGGWRQVPFVPPVATLLQPMAFQESLSFILLEAENLDLFRQGFWPDRRPQAGLIRWAEIEYATTRPEKARVKVLLVFHEGKPTEGQRIATQPPLLVQGERVQASGL